MVQARERQIAKERAKQLIVKGKLAKSNAATTLANAATKNAKDQLCAVKAIRKLATESADKGKKKVKNEKTAHITTERRAKLHVERAANANHNTWLDKKVSLNLLELQQQTEESEREKAEAARKKEQQTAANLLESEQKKVKS